MKSRILILPVIVLSLFILILHAQAQNNIGAAVPVYRGTALPAACAVGDFYYLTSGTTGFYACTAANTWTAGGLGTATLGVASGGTSLATLTAHALYVGNGTSAPSALAVCGTGTYIRGAAGADPICSTLILANAATAGDIVVATSTNTLGAVADVAVNQVLTSGGAGVVPAYSASPTLTALTAATITSTGNLFAAAASSIHMTGRAGILSSADKLLQIEDTGNATGMELDAGSATLGTCTGGTIVTGSHNTVGGYTGNTSASCVVNFGTPNWTNTPFCFAHSRASTTHPRISAVSTASMTITGGVSGEQIDFFCIGRIGT